MKTALADAGHCGNGWHPTDFRGNWHRHRGRGCLGQHSGCRGVRKAEELRDLVDCKDGDKTTDKDSNNNVKPALLENVVPPVEGMAKDIVAGFKNQKIMSPPGL